MAWPKEYGGQGASITMQMIFNEEMAYRGVPSRSSMGVHIVGPAIMLYGNEEQKRGFLSAIAHGENEWCQGFSEPNSGSDLASLRTTALESDDGYIINGQKIWANLEIKMEDNSSNEKFDEIATSIRKTILNSHKEIEKVLINYKI